MIGNIIIINKNICVWVFIFARVKGEYIPS